VPGGHCWHGCKRNKVPTRLFFFATGSTAAVSLGMGRAQGWLFDWSQRRRATRGVHAEPLPSAAAGGERLAGHARGGGQGDGRQGRAPAPSLAAAHSLQQLTVAPHPCSATPPLAPPLAAAHGRNNCTTPLQRAASARTFSCSSRSSASLSALTTTAVWAAARTLRVRGWP